MERSASMDSRIVDREEARVIAETTLDVHIALDDDGVRELEQGWYFPYGAVAGPVAGSHGVIVNKRTGNVFRLGSAFPVERDLRLYDRGYQFGTCDLVITSVRDARAALDALGSLGLHTVDETHEHGTVWRIPRALTRRELAERIVRLPCVFEHFPLYFKADALEAVRLSSAFDFDVVPSPRRASETRTPDAIRTREHADGGSGGIDEA